MGGTSIMKKYTLYILTIAALAFASACHKTPQPTPVPDPEPGPIYEDMKDNEIWYTTTDGRAMTPVNIGDFDVNYVSTVFDKETGTGVMYFDGPIKKIGDNAFAGSEILTTVVLPETVQTIGKNAFKGCTNLTSVEFNGSVNEICDYAFSECPFETFEFPSKITKMGTGVLKDCKALAKVTFSKSDAVIGDNCLEGCEALTEVTLPTQSTRIGDYAFKGCSSLTTLHAAFEGTLPTVGKDAFENGSHLFVRVDYDRFQDYKSAWGDNAKHVMVGAGSEKIDRGHWTEYMPECMPLSFLTVPGLHDAATWMCDITSPINDIIKDQAYDYSHVWDIGARAFDMRLGYDNNIAMGDLDDRCCFYHGDFSDEICKLHRFSEDINDHFPSPDKLDSSFMILIAKMENCDWDKGYLNVFEHFMSLLISKYSADRFISYNPSLTLGDIKGKIALFVRDSVFVGDYSKINGLKQVPVNYMDFDTSEIIPYVDAKETGDKYKILIQDKYEVIDANAKYQAIHNALGSSNGDFLVVNGFNAVRIQKPKNMYSWPISSKLNRMIVNDLEPAYPDPIYMRPMGIVLYDFCGYDTYTGMFGVTFDFAGDALQTHLVRQNFLDRY